MGTNDTALQLSKLTKAVFNYLFNFLKCYGMSVFISGPIPTVLVVSADSLASTARFSLHVGLMMWVLLTISIYSGIVCLFLTGTESIQTNWAHEC